MRILQSQNLSRKSLVDVLPSERSTRVSSGNILASVETKTKKKAKPEPQHSNSRSLAACGFTVERRVVDPITAAESVEDITRERFSVEVGRAQDHSG
jgi:hypothetical protein